MFSTNYENDKSLNGEIDPVTVHNWDPRDNEASSSPDNEESTQFSDDLSGDYNPEGDKDVELHLNKLRIGGKVGRPCKNPKVSSYFDVKRANKIFKFKKKSNIQKGVEAGVSGTKIDFSPVDNLESNTLALVPINSPNLKAVESHEQLVHQILEVGELMGLIDPSEKEQASALISKNLSE